MKINFSTCSEEELWKYVAIELAKNEVDVILVGGAVVSIYTSGAYKLGDLDFVIYDLSKKKLNKVLNSLGFFKDGRQFKHPDCHHLFLEFTTFPVGIGEDYEITPAKVKIEGQDIKIYSPTDCVRDRLASYIYFQAKECLDQAIMVAQSYPVNLTKIKDWCLKEKNESYWQEFLSRLKKN